MPVLQTTSKSLHRHPNSLRSCRSRRNVATSAKLKTKVGFKWDPANARWKRDDRLANTVDKTGVVIKPMSGIEYTVWPVVHATLTELKLKCISNEEAAELSSKGWTFVDIRLPEQFAQGHPTGAVNVPMYRYVEGDSVWDNLKRLAMAGFAMKATERNPDFGKEAVAKVGKNAKVIVVCDIGGSLDTFIQYRTDKPPCNDPDRAFGRESRSLKAVYELLQEGWNINNIRHLKKGYFQWRFDGFDCEAE